MINLEITFKCWKISEYLAHFKIFHRIFGFKMYVFKLGALNFQMIVNIFVKLWAEVCIERHYFLMRFIFLYIRKNKVMYSGISSTSSSWNIHGRFWIFFFFFFFAPQLTSFEKYEWWLLYNYVWQKLVTCIHSKKFCFKLHQKEALIFWLQRFIQSCTIIDGELHH